MTAKNPIDVDMIPDVIELIDSPSECIVISDSDEDCDGSRDSTSLLARVSTSNREAVMKDEKDGVLKTEWKPYTDGQFASTCTMHALPSSTTSSSSEKTYLFHGSISISQVGGISASIAPIIQRNFSVTRIIPSRRHEKIPTRDGIPCVTIEDDRSDGEDPYARTTSKSPFNFSNIMESPISNYPSVPHDNASIKQVAPSELPDLEIISCRPKLSANRPNWNLNLREMFDKQIINNNSCCTDVPMKTLNGFSKMPDVKPQSLLNSSSNRTEILEHGKWTTVRGNAEPVGKKKKRYRQLTLAEAMMSEIVKKEPMGANNGTRDREHIPTPVRHESGIFEPAPCRTLSVEYETPSNKCSEMLGQEKPVIYKGERSATPVKTITHQFKPSDRGTLSTQGLPPLRRHSEIIGNDGRTTVTVEKTRHRSESGIFEPVPCRTTSVECEPPSSKYLEMLGQEELVIYEGEHSATPVKMITHHVKPSDHGTLSTQGLPPLRRHSEIIGNEGRTTTMTVEKTRHRSESSVPAPLQLNPSAECVPPFRNCSEVSKLNSLSSEMEDLSMGSQSSDYRMELEEDESRKPGVKRNPLKRHAPRDAIWFRTRPNKYFLLNKSDLEPEPSSSTGSCMELPDLIDLSQDDSTSEWNVCKVDVTRRDMPTSPSERPTMHSINLKLNTPNVEYKAWTPYCDTDMVKFPKLAEMLSMAEMYLNETSKNSLAFTSRTGLHLLQEYVTQTGHIPKKFVTKLLQLLRMNWTVQLTYETLVHFHRFDAISRDINWWTEIGTCMETLNNNETMPSSPPGAFYALQFILNVLAANAEQVYVLPNAFTLKKCIAYRHISDYMTTSNACQLAKWLGVATIKMVPTDTSLVDLLSDFLTLAIAIGRSPLSMAAGSALELRTVYHTMSLDGKKILLRSLNCRLLRYRLVQLCLEDLGFVTRNSLAAYPVTCRTLMDTSYYTQGKNLGELLMLVKYAFQDYCLCAKGQLHLPLHQRQETQLPTSECEILVNLERLLSALEDHLKALYPQESTTLECQSALWHIRLASFI